MSTEIIIIGKEEHKIKLNFHEVINPTVSPDIISEAINITCENLSPKPFSICSN